MTAPTSFRLEREMTPAARCWLAMSGLQIWEEYQTATGVCDLVAVEVDPRGANTRIQLGQRKAVLNARRLQVLEAFPTSDLPATAAFIADTARIETDQVVADLGWLIKSGFVSGAPAVGYVRVRGDAHFARRVVAVELKLNKVQQALHQAFLRTAFADEVFVGLPADEAWRAKASSVAYEFESRGVGLLAVSNRRCNVLIAPAAAGARDSVLRALCAERFWNRSATTPSS